MSSSSPSKTTSSNSSSDEAIPNKIARLEGVEERPVDVEPGTFIRVKTNDDKIFSVDFELLKQSHLIKNMIMDLGFHPSPDGEPLLLKNVDGDIFAKILEWCAKHKGEAEYDIDEKENKALPLPPWDQDWFQQLHKDVVIELCKAANFMEIKTLLDLSCKAIANMMNGKTAQEIRELFDIENDFTPEEEAAFDANPIWCDDF